VLLQSEFVTLETERRSTLLLLKLKVLDLKLVVPLPPLHELKEKVHSSMTSLSISPECLLLLRSPFLYDSNPPLVYITPLLHKDTISKHMI
jgi:hypothetical protein